MKERCRFRTYKNITHNNILRTAGTNSILQLNQYRLWKTVGLVCGGGILVQGFPLNFFSTACLHNRCNIFALMETFFCCIVKNEIGNCDITYHAAFDVSQLKGLSGKYFGVKRLPLWANLLVNKTTSLLTSLLGRTCKVGWGGGRNDRFYQLYSSIVILFHR